MSRWKAAAIHLSISATIGLLVGALLLFVWYPRPYFHAAGADELVLLLVGVDLVLGPLLTLVVFKAGKKGLRFDLSLIAAMQATALIYGLSVVLRSRPVFVVAAIDRFVLVPANGLDPADLAKGSQPQFRALSWTGPVLVGAILPTDPKARNDLVFSGAAGKDLERFPQYYAPYPNVAKAMLTHAKSLDTLQAISTAVTQETVDWLHAHGRTSAEVVWLPLVGPHADMTMLMEHENGQVLGALAINPWPALMRAKAH